MYNCHECPLSQEALVQIPNLKETLPTDVQCTYIYYTVRNSSHTVFHSMTISTGHDHMTSTSDHLMTQKQSVITLNTESCSIDDTKLHVYSYGTGIKGGWG